MRTTAELTRRAEAYGRLAKLYFYDYFLGALLVWTLLAPAVRTEPRTLLVLVLFDLGWLGVVSAAVALDDVTGYRDGSDDLNNEPGSTLRDRSRKPLLDGSLTVRQAVRFGWASAAGGAALWGLTFLVAPHRPAGALALAGLSLVVSVQYSYGLRLSYRGGQELVILLTTGLSVLLPAWLLLGGLTGLVLLEAYLFGLWNLLISVYSNVHDIAGDRAAGRRNLATRLPVRRYRALIGLLTATGPAAVGLAVAAGAVPWWIGLVLLLVVVLHGRQAYVGLRRDRPLAARRLGIVAHRVGIVALVAANPLLVG